MESFYTVAQKKLQFVYLGNVRLPDKENTFCPSCKKLLIERSGYMIRYIGLTEKQQCIHCGTPIAGCFK
jgi:pyruvate formate lyase activating enzyme